MIELIAGDFLTLSADDLADWCTRIQCMITDPPYSPHVHKNITSAGTMGKGSRGWHRQELEFAPLSSELQCRIARAAARIPGWSVIYSDHESSHDWRVVCGLERVNYIRGTLVELEDEPEGYVDAMPWERWSQPQKSGDRPPTGFEVLSLFWGQSAGRKAWNGPGNLTCLRHKALRGEDKHRTEKPLDQALDLVSWFSNHPTASDGAVFDPCSGAGTTATACALLGRDFVGFELLPKWAEAGQARADAALRGELSARDRERAESWVLATIEQARKVPEPRRPDGADRKTWERAQRRIADADRVARKLLDGECK